MKNNLFIVSALLIIIHQKSSAQCTASIINFSSGSCEGTDIELIASGGGTNNGYSYSWTGPQGFTSSGQFVAIPQAPASASGFYKVKITDPAGCSASDSIEIIKHPNPHVYTGGEAGGCLNATTYIYADDYAGNYGPYTYYWDNGATTRDMAITHGGGTYPAPACTMTNIFGCSAANNTTFLIYTYPSPVKPVIEALSATSFCSGSNVTLTTPADPYLTYQWKKYNNPITGASSDSYVASSTANYSVTASNAVGCAVRSNAIHVTVFAKPQAAITVSGSLNVCNGNTVLLNANSGTGLSYQWRKYGNEIAGAVSSSLSVNKKGNYSVIVTNQEGCTKISPVVFVTSNCREESMAENSSLQFSVYPNPSDNIFNLQLNEKNNNENIQLVITDVIGRKISEENILNNNGIIRFGENLNAGIYFLTVANGNDVQTKRIIKTE